jgi:hypothetical protein
MRVKRRQQTGAHCAQPIPSGGHLSLEAARAARAFFGGGMHFGSDREFNLPLGYKGGERYLHFRQTGEKYVR